MTMPPAIAPPFRWRQKPPYPEPPPGYRLVIGGTGWARSIRLRTGVSASHIAQCTYALWMPVEGRWDVAPDSPAAAAAREWLDKYGDRARAVLAALADARFGRAKQLAISDEMGAPINFPSTTMRDLHHFLRAAEAIQD